jgi:hypothetical protein
MQVVLPSGDPVWVSLGRDDPGEDGNGSGAQDAGLRDHVEAVIQAGKLPGFTEAIRGVVTSVREALEEHRPDEFTVDFGIQITAKTGSALSVVAAGEGSAQIRVSATWRRDGIPSSGRQQEPGEPE